MKKNFAIRAFGLSVIASALFHVSMAFAAPVFVDNFSFETLPPEGLPNNCGPGCQIGNGTTIPGWAFIGGGAQFQPGVQASNFTYFNSVPDGITVVFSNGGTISQTVGSTVQQGVVYTLQVDLGQRKDLPNPGSVELRIGDNAAIVALGIAATPGSGDWSTYTATYIGLAADVGESITIALVTPGIQGVWDYVRLDATAAVPEPQTLPLLGLGLIALLGIARRKRRS